MFSKRVGRDSNSGVQNRVPTQIIKLLYMILGKELLKRIESDSGTQKRLGSFLQMRSQNASS